MIAALMLVAALHAALQGGAATEPRKVEGRVTRGTRAAQLPLANQMVVLHRVGRDHSGPLDSTRTNASGWFTFRYRPSGDSSAIYFATTSFGGIVYPTVPFRGSVVSSADASITVFDTTSGPVPIKVGGRHLIIGAPQGDGRRPVGEVYDLENDTTVTAIARDSVTPVWSAQIPAAAIRFQLNANGELANGAISRRGTRVGVFAPVSPGIRQVAFTYELPASAFPLRIVAAQPAGVMEVLVQEPTARVEAASLREVPPANAEGRVFRRFLVQDLKANAVLRIDVPRMSVTQRESIYRVVLYTFIAVMVVALAFAIQRGRRSARVVVVPAPAPAAEPRSRVLVRAIATLDDEFDRAGGGDAAARSEYETTRASLKRELTEVLATERQPS